VAKLVHAWVMHLGLHLELLLALLVLVVLPSAAEGRMACQTASSDMLPSQR